MTLDVCYDIRDIFNIPVISHIHDILTILEITIIIQISSRLWFRKGMTLDVCPDIPEIINIPDIFKIPNIPNIPDIPKIPTIPRIPIIIQISWRL